MDSSFNADGFTTFAQGIGGKSIYKEYGIVVETIFGGLSKGLTVLKKDATVAFFVEHGDGKYDSSREVSSRGIMQYTGVE